MQYLRLIRQCGLLLLCGVLVVSLAGCGTKRPRPQGRPSRPAAQKVTAAHTLQVTRTAQKQLGRPYRLGGASPQKGFDCSGLIYWSFQQHGIEVPRQTTAQARTGVAVPRNRLRPGDIVVFRTSGAPNGLHTGLYIGQDKFVHSPNSKSKVRVEALTVPYWHKRYMTARRVVYVRSSN